MKIKIETSMGFVVLTQAKEIKKDVKNTHTSVRDEGVGEVNRLAIINGEKILKSLYDYCDIWLDNGWVKIELSDPAYGTPEYKPVEIQQEDDITRIANSISQN